MWCLGTRFSGGLGSVRFMVVLNDLKALFQPKWFLDYAHMSYFDNKNQSPSSYQVLVKEQ